MMCIISTSTTEMHYVFNGELLWYNSNEDVLDELLADFVITDYGI